MAEGYFKHCINAFQSPVVRREKYRLCREHGLGYAQSVRFRDCRWSKIARLFGFQSVSDLLQAFGLDPDTYREGLSEQVDEKEAERIYKQFTQPN